jgi:hypothetical protein
MAITSSHEKSETRPWEPLSYMLWVLFCL